MNDVINERRYQWNGQGEWPAVSVIIVTRGRHEAAIEAVRSVLQVDYPAEKLEVVVIEETEDPSPIEGDQVRYVAIPMRNLGLGLRLQFLSLRPLWWPSMAMVTVLLASQYGLAAAGAWSKLGAGGVAGLLVYGGVLYWRERQALFQALSLVRGV